MTRTIPVVGLILSSTLWAQSESQPSTQGHALELQELIAKMKAAEKDVDSAVLEMVTRGTYPGGVGFEIRGSVRVLGGTHFHIRNRATFEDDLTSEQEEVRTPEGAWMREKDPAFGEVYLSMKPELLAELKRAKETLAGAGDEAPLADNPAEDPLGSAMLESLDRHFALEVQKRVIGGHDVLVVQGPVREAPPEPGESDFPQPDRVELLVRTPDLAVIQMTQFRDGKELMQVEITRLELNVPIDKGSFRIELPEGQRFLDVMEHPPAAAQIRDLLDKAKARREQTEDDKR